MHRAHLPRKRDPEKWQERGTARPPEAVAQLTVLRVLPMPPAIRSSFPYLSPDCQIRSSRLERAQDEKQISRRAAKSKDGSTAPSGAPRLVRRTFLSRSAHLPFEEPRAGSPLARAQNQEIQLLTERRSVMSSIPTRNDWTKPAAMSVPKGGFFKDKVEQGRYGAIFPK